MVVSKSGNSLAGQTYKCYDVDVIINAVGSEANDAGVKSKEEEKKHDSGQRPHDAEGPRGISCEVHVGDDDGVGGVGNRRCVMKPREADDGMGATSSKYKAKDLRVYKLSTCILKLRILFLPDGPIPREIWADLHTFLPRRKATGRWTKTPKIRI